MSHLLTKVEDILEVKMGGRWADISDAKEKIKDIPGRRWDPGKKVWTVPATPENADRILKTIRPECDDSLTAWIRESMSSSEESLTTPLPDDAELLVPWGNKQMPWQPSSVNDEEFKGALPYQRAAISSMAASGRALLADDMGLGKTFEALTAVEEWRLVNQMADRVTLPEGPRLVIAPASVLGGWMRELNRWLDDPPIQLVDSKDIEKRHLQVAQGIKDDAWLVVNWEQVRVKKLEVRNTKGSGSKKVVVMKEPLFEFPGAASWDLKIADWDNAAFNKAKRQFGKQTDWLAVLADEIHRAKNKDAQQTKGLWRIQGETMYGLTGTPIMNSPDEIWSLLRWLWPDQYHEAGEAHAPGAIPFWRFYDMYVDYWEDHFGRKVITGVKNPEALRYELKGKVIRRTAAILGLKGRKRFYYDVDLTPVQQKLYDEAEKAMWLAIQADVAEGNKNAIEFAQKAAAGGTPIDLMRIPNGAARFVRLQQIIENAALLGGSDSSANMDSFEQKYEDSGFEQWIVFCKYKESCTILAERLRKKFGANVAIYNGDVAAADRTKIEDSFQRGETNVVIGTISAMYQGITLTRGHLQFWLSREVVPAINEQGEARQDRLGQQDLVRVYIPQATSTVATEKVAVINTLKEGIVRTILPQDTIDQESA